MAVKINLVKKSPSGEGDTPTPQDSESPKKKRTYTRKAPRKSQKPVKPARSDKKIQDAEKLAASIKARHELTDEELLREIQVKPERANNVSHRLDKQQQEARLVLMHRLLIRKVSAVDIQKQLGITEEMYYYLRPKLDAMMRLDVSKLDVPYMIGDSLALYDEIRSMALVISSSGNIQDPKVKLAAMNVVLKAESDKNAFLTQCGVYAPQIIEHLVRGMITSGATLQLSGESPDRTKTVDQMVGELMTVLTGHVVPGSHPSDPTDDIEDVQLIASDELDGLSPESGAA